MDFLAFPIVRHTSCSKEAVRTQDIASSTGDPMRIDDVLQRIQGEFVEMPGLRLTPAQAQRLWGLDGAVCDQLLGTLVEARFLSRTRDGAFVRTDGTIARRMAPGNAA